VQGPTILLQLNARDCHIEFEHRAGGSGLEFVPAGSGPLSVAEPGRNWK